MALYAKVEVIGNVETVTEMRELPDDISPGDIRQVNFKPMYRPVVTIDVTITDPSTQVREGPETVILPDKVELRFSIRTLTVKEQFRRRMRLRIVSRRSNLPDRERELAAMWHVIDAILIRLVELQQIGDPTTFVQVNPEIDNFRQRVTSIRSQFLLPPDPDDTP